MNRKVENHTEADTPTEKLMHDLKEVVHDGEALLRSGAQGLSETTSDMRDRLAAALESAKDMGRRLQDRTVQGAKATDRMIRDNPYQTIGIAFGLGLLIGFLANRRGRD